MAQISARILHLLHSVDILLTFRSINPSRSLTFLPFLVKFALFIIVNSTRELFSELITGVDLDWIVMRDFILLYLVVQCLWRTEALRSILSVIKGPACELDALASAIRIVHMSAFTFCRILTGCKAVEHFSVSYSFSVFILFLFLELNGMIWNLLKKSFDHIWSTFHESIVVSLVVSADPNLCPLLVIVLLKRHLLTPTWLILTTPRKN